MSDLVRIIDHLEHISCTGATAGGGGVPRHNLGATVTWQPVSLQANKYNNAIKYQNLPKTTD